MIQDRTLSDKHYLLGSVPGLKVGIRREIQGLSEKGKILKLLDLLGPCTYREIKKQGGIKKPHALNELLRNGDVVVVGSKGRKNSPVYGLPKDKLSY